MGFFGMESRLPNQASRRWPFWLLLAAWFCANAPQGAVPVFMTWLGEARSFSHQKRLTVQVAHILVGEQAHGLLAKAENVPVKPPTPAVPAEAAWKMIHLTVELTTEMLPPLLRGFSPKWKEIIVIARLRPAPPHQPPRTRFIA